jgi:glucokinase
MSMLLVGDIGGTKTDLAVLSRERGPRTPVAQKRYPSGEYRSLEAIVRQFLTEFNIPVTQACMAVAGPVVNGRAVLTNLPWVVEEASLKEDLRLEDVSILNDVQAMANAIPNLGKDEECALQNGDSTPGGTIGLVAAGTGLGEAFLTWDGMRYHAFASEGGHHDFGPTTVRESDLLQFLRDRLERVSVERVCAGRGVPDIYDFLRAEGAIEESPALAAELAQVEDRTPAIMAAAKAPHPDSLALAAVDLFISILGSEAGNLALTVFATGGVYLAGGIIERLLPLSDEQEALFFSAFHSKGRLSPILARIPISAITKPVALVGAALHGFDAYGSSIN